MDGIAQSAADVDAGVARIVSAYGDMVYAAALRQMHQEALARDVVQGVFVVLLAKMRKGIGPSERAMAGWLLQTTAYVAKEARRASWRRKRRELAAMEGAAMRAAQEGDMRECLDAALLTLGAMDREAVARRYLRGESVQAVASALGLTENAVSKRIGRALEKLRRALARRGVIAPAAAVTAVAVAEALVKMPAMGAEVGGLTGQALARRMLWRQAALRAGVMGAVAAVCIGMGAAAIIGYSRAAKTAAAQVQEEPLLRVGTVLEPSSDRLVQQILAGIEENRRKLKNIEIVATDTTTLFDPEDAGDFKTVGKGWIEAAAPQRFRVEISLQQSPWTNGAAPLLEDSFWETWDGGNVRILHRPPHSNTRGEIAGKEMYADGYGILGLDYSMQLPLMIGMATGDKEIKEDPLDVEMLRKMRLAGRRVMLNGRAAMELEVRFRAQYEQVRRFSRRYWFDAARGYALLGSEEGMDGDRPLEQRVVDEVTQAAPGVFYPMHGRMISYVRDHDSRQLHLWMRDDFQATRVTANQPLAPGIFQIDFPAGISVTQRGAAAASQPATRR